MEKVGGAVRALSLKGRFFRQKGKGPLDERPYGLLARGVGTGLLRHAREGFRLSVWTGEAFLCTPLFPEILRAVPQPLRMRAFQGITAGIWPYPGGRYTERGRAWGRMREAVLP